MMVLKSTVYSVELLASYEGEGNGEGQATGQGTIEGGNQGGSQAAGEGAGQGAPSGEEGGEGSDRTFSQDDLNRFLADDRRKTEAKFKDKVTALETSYQEALTNKELTDSSRKELEDQLESVRAIHRTKEQQVAHDKKVAAEQHQTELDTWQEKAKTWEGRYTESTITRELQAAAVTHDAYNPDLVVTQLKSTTHLEDQVDSTGKPTGNLVPMVTMSVKNDDTGAQETLKMTPLEAVEYMKKIPDLYGGLFKNNIREGIGSSSATGGAMSGDGTIDITKLTDEQYFKMRKENPAALGLKPTR